MKEESVDWPVHREMSMISRESLMRDFTDSSCGRMMSEVEDEAWNISRVEGVDVVVPLGVFGGSVARRRWMSCDKNQHPLE